MALTRGNEIPTIDVSLVTITTANNATEIALIQLLKLVLQYNLKPKTLFN